MIRNFYLNKEIDHSREQRRATPLSVQCNEAPWVAECAYCD